MTRPTAVGLIEPDDRAAELARLREFLWLGLVVKAVRQEQVATAAIRNLEEISTVLAPAAHRRRGAYPASGMSKWARQMRDAISSNVRIFRAER